MGNAMPRQNDPQTRGAARSMGQAPADWFVDPAAPSAEPSAAEQLPGLEEQAEAFLAQADAATGTSPENLATTEQELDLHSSDPQILKLWQQAAGAYGVDEDEGELAWQADALCAQTDPEAFFPEKGGSTRDAKRVCAECPVSAQCLEYALAKDERFGIWGGLSERERRRMRKRAS